MSTRPLPRLAALTVASTILASAVVAVPGAAAVDDVPSWVPAGEVVDHVRAGHVNPAFAAAAARVAAARTPGEVTREDGRAPHIEFIGNNYFDECADGGLFDVKKFSIIDNTTDELTYLWGTCPGRPAPTSGNSSIVFFIDDGGRPGSPSLAVVQSTIDASWIAFETNGSSDEADWDAIQEGVGDITRVGAADGGPRDVGSIDIDALEADFPLSYFVSVATVVAGDVRDVIPELTMPPIHFPDGCDYFELQAARIVTDDFGALVLSTAAQASIGAGSIARVDGSRLAWPVTARQLASLDALPGVEATRPRMYRAHGDPEPTTWAIEQTRLDRAWQAVPNASATIAVLDQGVDGTRVDLQGRVGVGYDALTNERFPAGHDSALGPHGTAVSGIAAATRDNDLEVAGVNDGATIVPVRVFDHSSCADDNTIAAGLDWASERDVDVINLSLGGPGDSDVLHSAIQRAEASGAIIIAATGNDDEASPGRPSYPAAYPEVIGIGATGPDGVATYSQRAATDYVAPGGAYSGQQASDYAVLSEWNRIEFQAGTSFAAPFVSGLVSLWLRDRPGATMAEVRDALTAAAVDLPGDRDGQGLIDAVNLLGDKPRPVPPVAAAPGIDGDPTTSHRLPYDDAITSALAVSALRFDTPESAPVAVVARDDAFADALSGAALSKTGPLLFTRTGTLDARVRQELLRVLAQEGTIYLLGGTSAISASVEAAIREARPDATVKRLAGADRFQTSRAIVRETVAVHGVASQILVARGFGPATDPNGTAAWADAIAAAPLAASRGWPLLIVPSGGVTQADLDVIDETVANDGLANLLGGTSALHAGVADAISTVRKTRRIAGDDRDATAVSIARTLWGSPTTGPATYALLNVRSSSGWFLGLASAGYAATIGAPILSVNAADIPAPTNTLLARCGDAEVELWVAGATSQIGQATLAEADRRDGAAC